MPLPSALERKGSLQFKGKGSRENPYQVMGCAAQKVEAAFLLEVKQGLSASLAKGIAVRKASVPIVGEEEVLGRCQQG